MARIFDSEIKIDSYDRWFFRGNEITQGEILKYFRQNLRQSDQGVYIHNQFGELVENGYLHIEGFPAHIIHVKFEGGLGYLQTDAGEWIPETDWEIFRSRDDSIFVTKSVEDKIRYRFDWNAASVLSQYLYEEGEAVYIQFDKVAREVIDFNASLLVDLPKSFDFV